MARYQYRIFGRTSWSATPGVALAALVNNVGSGKKIDIQSIEISNSSRLGYMNTIDTASAVPTRYIVAMVSGLSGGQDITSTAAPFDTNFPALSGLGTYPISIKTGAVWSMPFTQFGTQTYTDASVAIGDTTFTPGSTPSPAWIASEHRDTCRYFIVGSGNNIGTYKITANTATALTLDPPLYQVGSTTGYIGEYKGTKMRGIIKCFTSTAGTPHFINTVRGDITDGRGFGTIYEKSRDDGTTQHLIINPGENVALIVPEPSAPNPGFFNMIFSVVNGGNTYRYVIDVFNAVTSEKESVISIENPAESGNTVRIRAIHHTETGSHDTPYFQVVPLAGVEATAYNDSLHSMSVIKTDTNHPDLSSSICKIFTQVPVYPYGVPFSYVAEGSAAVPKGINYLSTKDFLGPVFATIFPENAPYKTTGASTSLTCGTLGTHLSQSGSAVRSKIPITIREGEGFGIVAAAETAAGTTNVGVAQSGWGTYEFGITFTVDNATTPYLTLTGLQTGTEVRVYTHGTITDLAGEENNTTGTFSWAYDYAPNTYVDIVIHNIQYEYLRLENILLTTGGLSIPIQQRYDRNYRNP